MDIVCVMCIMYESKEYGSLRRQRRALEVPIDRDMSQVDKHKAHKLAREICFMLSEVSFVHSNL
jgi:K+ transporter